jgi:hypothetical protein
MGGSVPDDRVLLAAIAAMRGGTGDVCSRVQREAGQGCSPEDARDAVETARQLYELAYEAADRARDRGTSETVVLAWLARRVPGHGREVYERIMAAAFFDTR